MQRYDVKLTIEGLSGAFSEKHSHLVRGAQRLDRYLTEIGESSADGPLRLLSSENDGTAFDPMAIFPVLMKQLRRVSLEHAEKPFFDGLRFEPRAAEPGPWAAFHRLDEGGETRTIQAFGRKAVLIAADGAVQPLQPTGDVLLESAEGLLRCRQASLKTLFRDDLLRIIELCEEAMAKNAALIATVQASTAD